MDISWYGLSCFRLVERGHSTIVTDPFGPKLGLEVPKLKSDIVTISHDAKGHNHVDAVTGYHKVLNGPGEYEIGGVFINGVASHTNGVRNVHFVYDYSGIKVLHLGDISKVPSQTQIEAMGEINVLLLPVGGGSSLNSVQASELVSMLEPNYVIPMHFAQPGLKIELDEADRFLKEMGVTEPEPENVLKLSASSLPDETQTVVLAPR